MLRWGLGLLSGIVSALRGRRCGTIAVPGSRRRVFAQEASTIVVYRMSSSIVAVVGRAGFEPLWLAVRLHA